MVYNPFSPITRFVASKIAPVVKSQTQKFTTVPVIKPVTSPAQPGRGRVSRPLYEVTAPRRITGLSFGDVDTSSFPKAGGGTLPTSQSTKDRMAAALKAAYTKPGFYSTYNYQTKKYELRPIPGKESEQKALDKVLSRFNFGTSEYQFRGGAGFSPPSLRGVTSRVALSPRSEKKKSRTSRTLQAAGLVGGGALLIDEATGFLSKGQSGLDPNFVNQPASLNPSITTPPAGTTSTVGSTGGGARAFEVPKPQSPDSFFPGEGGLNEKVAEGAAGKGNPTTPSFGRSGPSNRANIYGGGIAPYYKRNEIKKPSKPVINPTGFRPNRTRNTTKLPNRNNQFKINWL